LNGTVYDFLGTAVVAKMDNLCPARLNNSAHDVDRSIMSIEEGGGCNNPDFVYWLVWLGLYH
jgi:hypothetical protein